MNEVVEKILVGLGSLLLLFIVGVIVMYNMQETKVPKMLLIEEDTVSESVKKNKTNYLNNLENYSDIDVKVDPTKENSSNIVNVVAEGKKNDLSVVVEDKSKSSYMQNLENYSENSDNAEPNTPTELDENAPIELEKSNIADELGMAIDAAISD